MRMTVRTLALIPAIAFAAACSKSDKQMDDALKNDLALANQTNPNQVVSPLERGDTTMLTGTQQLKAGTTGTTAVRNVSAPSRTVVHHRTVTHHVYSSSGGSNGGYSTGSVYSAPAPSQPETRHTKRDATVGAVAGAVIGAATSHDKLKGGIIGAAAGGILGGIIGNNVDVKKH